MNYEQIYEWSNILLAWRKASKGKRGSRSCAAFEYRLTDELLMLQQELINGSYKPGGYTHFYIHEPKKRKISAARFRDRVVHHALCNIIEPRFESQFIPDSYANRVGKGTHQAVSRLQYFSRRYRYVLRLDIVKHFPSMDDDLLSLCRPRGLPIGNLTSQFWSNCYLHPLDCFIKRELSCKPYLRYVDDFALFSNSKEQLWHWKQAVQNKLASLRLNFHEHSAQVIPVSHGIPWLGFVVHPNYITVKSRKVVFSTKRLNSAYAAWQAGEISFVEFDARVQGWINYVRYADSWGLRKQVLKGFKR